MNPSFLLNFSFFMFAIGAAGFVMKKSMIMSLMFLELMLNAANMAAVALLWNSPNATVFILFILALAAAEAGAGLAIAITIAKRIKAGNISNLRKLRN